MKEGSWLKCIKSCQSHYKIFETDLPFVSELSKLQDIEARILYSVKVHNYVSKIIRKIKEFLLNNEIIDGELLSNAEDKITIANMQLMKTMLQNDHEEIDNAISEWQEQIDELLQQIELKKEQLRKGLFTADKSFVGRKCVICQEDIEVGRKVKRLDCDGQHIFCQVCIEGWFTDHNTCPICRHKIK